jgi:hypothetical protein
MAAAAAAAATTATTSAAAPALAGEIDETGVDGTLEVDGRCRISAHGSYQQ